MAKTEHLTLPTSITVALNKVITSGDGTAEEPAISFGNDTSSGWYLDKDGNVVFTAWGSDNIIQTPYYTEFRTSLMFHGNNDAVDIKDDHGLLYKKKDSQSLWWRTAHGDVDLTAGGFPDSLHMVKGTATLPSYSFSGDEKSGIFAPVKGAVALSAMGIEGLRVTDKLVKALQPLELTDAPLMASPASDFSGYLYKKAGSDGIFWKTKNIDIDLTTGLPPVLTMGNGSAVAPVYSFKTAPNAGMFLVGPEDIGFGITGVDKLHIKAAEITSQVPIKTLPGDAKQPSYSFVNSPNTGLFSSAIGSLDFACGGLTVINITKKGLTSTGQIFLPNGTDKAPSITFIEDQTSGIYRKNINTLAVGVGGSDVLLLSSSGIAGTVPIYVPDGDIKSPSLSFASDVSSGLYKKQGALGMTVGSIDVLQLKADSITTGVPIKAAQGSKAQPQYAFSENKLAGFYYDSKTQTIGFGNTANGIEIDPAKVKVNGTLDLNGGQLYTKPESKGLYWSSGGSEVDVANMAIKYPLQASTDGTQAQPAYSFMSDPTTGIYKNGTRLVMDVLGKPVLSLGTLVSFDVPLEIKDSVQVNPSDTTRGVLYREPGTGHLIWNTTGIQYNLTKKQEQFVATSLCDRKHPDFTFKADPMTGLYSVKQGTLGVAVDGFAAYEVNLNATSFNNPIILRNSAGNLTSPNEGMLYKKDGSAGLWWKTDKGEVDVVAAQFPIQAPENVSPSYGFSTNPGTGMFYSGGTLGFSIGGQVGLSMNQQGIFAKKPITLDKGGRLSQDGDSLLWTLPDGKTTNISAGLTFPLMAPNDESINPSYSFASDVHTGIYHAGTGTVGIAADGVLAMSVSENGVSVSKSLVLGDMTSPVDNTLPGGQLYKKLNDVNLYWMSGGVEYQISQQAGNTFMGGLVSNPITLPAGSSDVPSLTFTNDTSSGLFAFGTGPDFNLAVVNGGVPSVQLGLLGVIARSYEFLDSSHANISFTNGQMSLTTAGVAGISIGDMFVSMNKRLRIKDTNTSSVNPSNVYGELFKLVGDPNLYWQTEEGLVNLTADKGVMYPMLAPPAMSPVYSFANSKGSGMYADPSGKVIITSNGIDSIALSNGHIYSISGGSLAAPAYSFGNDQRSGVVFSGGIYSIVISGISALNINNESVSTTETIGVSGVNGSVAGFCVQNDKTLGITTGTTTAIELDESKVTIDRVLEIKSDNVPDSVDAEKGALYKKKDPDQSLYWKTATSEVNLTAEKSNDLAISASMNINKGDVVCYDQSGGAVVAIGGKVASVKVGNGAVFAHSHCSNMFTINGDTSLLVQGSSVMDVTIKVKLLFTWYQGNTFVNQVVYNVDLGEGTDANCYMSVVQLSTVHYALVLAKESDTQIHYIKLKCVLNEDVVEISKAVILMTSPVGALDAVYDNVIDLLVTCAYTPANMDYCVVMVTANGTSDEPLLTDHPIIDPALTNGSIIDLNKQMHAVILPGQTVLVSYGNRKTTFIINTTAVMHGMTMIDYETYDCVDMLYDTTNGVVISIEATITPSCFIQALDILGTNIQRLTSKNFKNQTMEPFSIAYNAATGNYGLLFADGSNNSDMFIQNIQFDGEEFSFGMKYELNGVYVQNAPFRMGKFLMPLPGLYSYFAIWAAGTGVQCVTFIDGFNGYPEDFLGVASSSATAGQVVQVTPRGTIYKTDITMNKSWLGKKLYVVKPSLAFPNNLSNVGTCGAFLGTCLTVNKIILGV
jgi:hypothetical protein